METNTNYDQRVKGREKNKMWYQYLTNFKHTYALKDSHVLAFTWRGKTKLKFHIRSVA